MGTSPLQPVWRPALQLRDLGRCSGSEGMSQGATLQATENSGAGIVWVVLAFRPASKSFISVPSRL